MADFKPTERPYDVTHYGVRLSLDPSENPNQFQATAEIDLKATQDVDELVFNAEDLAVEKVRTNGKGSLEFSMKGNELHVTLPGSKKKGSAINLHVDYRGSIGSAHSGFFKVTDPDEPQRGPLFFTHFEALGARKFFPCNDEPYDKATTEIAVSVPTPFQAISNGKLVTEKKFKRDKRDWAEYHWKLEKPHPTYLVSLAVGRFKKISSLHNGVEVSVYVGETKEKAANYALEATVNAMGFFEHYLGIKYPWSKYATIGVPTFLWGGMENTSATHMNEERTVLVDSQSEYDKKRIVTLAAHELAHQWFGDLVTMKWWDDLWLNESFASFMESLGTKHHFKNEEADMDLVLFTWDDYFRQEDGPRSHPIVNASLSTPDDAFDAISYTKGENVLRMLNHYVGEENFRKSLKAYLEQFSYGNATYMDFFSVVEKTSKEKLSGFRDSWLLQRGYPVITYGGKWDSKTSMYELRLSQHSNHASDKALFDFKVPVSFHRRSTPVYDKDFVVKMTDKSSQNKFELLAEPEWVTVNGKSIVLGRVVPETRDEGVLALQAINDPEPIARVWAAMALMDNLFTGGSMSSTGEKAVASIITDDTSPYVRTAILSEVKRMKVRWLPEKIADAVWTQAQKHFSIKNDNDPLYAGDLHGWRQFRSKLLVALGKVKRKEVVPFLASVLGKENVGLDDLAEAAVGVAMQGDDKSADVLKSALNLHKKRGYHYTFSIQFAFGALENVSAANEIREISRSCGSDVMGRFVRSIRDNQTLKNSQEWAQFLKDFVLDDKSPFGEEVKARLLQSIEDVKTPSVKVALQSIVDKSSSARMKEVAENILKSNF